MRRNRIVGNEADGEMQGSDKTGMNYKSEVERQQGRLMDIKPFEEGLRRPMEMERIREISVCPL